MNDKITFNNLVTVDLGNDDEIVWQKQNAQTLVNRNLLIDLYNGTNPSIAVDAALTIRYTTVANPGGLTINVSSANNTTTEPTGSTDTAWGYEKTLLLYDGAELGVPSRGTLIVRGRVYFGVEAQITRVDFVDNGNILTLFSAEENGTVPETRSARITYRLAV